MRTRFQSSGFELLADSITVEEIELLEVALKPLVDTSDVAGIRGLLSRSSEVRAFARESSVAALATRLLGNTAFPVRAILFDKTPKSNWYVTWHQDLMIPVKSKVDVHGFSAWSVKEGVTHVQPPAYILETMVSIRVHLDPCPIENGAIKFLPGSHRSGVLSNEQIEEWKSRIDAIHCPANVGEMIAMRPLVLHSSSVSSTVKGRRVLHIEYAGVGLPGGLEWEEC